MRALHRHDRKQIHMSAGFGNLDSRRESCQPTAYYDDFRIRHYVFVVIPNRWFCGEESLSTPTNQSIAKPIAPASELVMVYPTFIAVRRDSLPPQSGGSDDNQGSSMHLLAFYLSRSRRISAHMSPCWIGRRDECPHCHHPHDHKQQSNHQARRADFAPCALPLCDSPFGTEKPDSIGEVPRRADDRDDVNGEHPGIHQFLLNLAKSGAGILKQSRPTEPQVI